MFKRVIRSITLRRRTAWVITGLLLLPFVLFFHASGRLPTGGPGGAAGRIFGKDVPWEEFQEQRIWIRRQFANQVGPDLSPELNQLITQYTWERLMLLAEAKRIRLRVHDQALAAFIQRIPGFQEQGRFLPERYYRFVEAIGLTPQMFETFVRQDLAVEQLISQAKVSVSVTDEEVRSAYHEAHERVRVALIAMDPARHRETVRQAITEDELRADYEAHPDAVRVPGYVTFESIGETREALRERATVTEEAIAEYYASRPEEFARARPPGPPGTRAGAGGDDVQRAGGETTAPLDDVREAIRERLLDQDVSRALIGLAIELEDGRAAGQSFEELATAHHLVPQRIGPVADESLWAPGQPESALLDAARALTPGAMSPVVETDSGVYVLRVIQRAPARMPPLEEVRATVEERLVEHRALEAAKAAANTLHDTVAKRLEDGVTFEAACSELGVSPVVPAPFTRTEPIDTVGEAPFVTAAAFATSVGGLSPVVESPAGSVVLWVHERIPADDAGLTAEEQERLRNERLADKEQAQLASWLADLRSRANVQSFLDNLEEGT
jgi:peptidyl-prolyl cis-trans isomerase D